MSARVIFHIDLNAFYATAAQIEDPSLKGKPVAICRNSRGAVVTTASYEARAFGVKSAMPLAVALQKCPELVVVDPDFSLYRRFSDQFIEYIKTISPIVEVLSIDECFVDVTKQIKQFKRPLDLAVKIQNDLKEIHQLSCSIGVAPNRFLAKMASDFKKPMGISVLRKREVKQKLWPLSIESFYGIGKVTQAKLKDIGIYTIGDLACCDTHKLEPILHNQTHTLKERANGNDSSILETDTEVKSISASNSLFSGVTDYEELISVLYEQCQDIHNKCKKHELMGQTLTVSVGFNQEKSTSTSKRYESGLYHLDDIYEGALTLFDGYDLDEMVTFVSTGLNNLIPYVEEDEIFNLFNYNNVDHSVSDIITKINSLFDTDVVKKASDEND